ncbi:hypothetical protein M569_12009 [Genlisea aurea]|uniref:Uncharacterized protein n=1 Tax=Genlisea aurea TaxID=192259 RepID=S8C7L1_9LAMI|nr:hypothetical protein M569_12009 [Genlisea aurea]
MGGSKWVIAKLGLGLNLNSCLQEPRTIENSQGSKFSDGVRPSSRLAGGMRLSPTPPPSSEIRHSSKTCEKICSICLVPVTAGKGQAIFTAECSHSFHFHCIAANVKHGRQTCPVCRSKWKDVPFQSPAVDTSPVEIAPNGRRHQQDEMFRLMRRVPNNNRRRPASVFDPPEPGVYDDDDEIAAAADDDDGRRNGGGGEGGRVEVETYCEVSAVPRLESRRDFSVLVHLKAPPSTARRAPVDLVAVLDVSGSMSGSKLALLKRAVGFVIQNLGPSDRLSVVAFSSTARRVFPLRRMTDSGREFSLMAVNSLSSTGGTNISEGLRKAAKVMADRKSKNPVSSMILLSDGQDTYAARGTAAADAAMNPPPPLAGIHFPVHTFGFGSDHDAVSMHSISESSGGTFSFIESENVIQDAFAQCIGGLLTVVVQELELELETLHPTVRIASVKSGGYRTALSPDRRKARVDVGLLYADEARDFLVTADVPADEFSDETSLFKVSCGYRTPASKIPVGPEISARVTIRRPFVVSGDEAAAVSREVDRERNRIRSSEAMAEARAAAEKGDLSLAANVLGRCREEMLETASAKCGDPLVTSLIRELTATKERMANRQVYAASGRAYVLSGLSSHSWQRATARGDSSAIADGSFIHGAYQTPSMVDMVNLSQTASFSQPRSKDENGSRSFPAKVQPR